MTSDLKDYLKRRVFNNKKYGISPELAETTLKVWESLVKCEGPTPFASAGKDPIKRTPFVFFSWNNSDYYIEVEIHLDHTEWCLRDRSTEECTMENLNILTTIPDYVVSTLKKMVK